MENNIVILIDGDNISLNISEYIYEIAREKGNIICSRLYGDFSNAKINKWKDICNGLFK